MRILWRGDVESGENLPQIPEDEFTSDPCDLQASVGPVYLGPATGESAPREQREGMAAVFKAKKINYYCI